MDAMKCFEKNNVPPGYAPVEGSKCHATEEECAKECRKCTTCVESWDFAYFDVVQTKNYKDSFRIEYGSLNTDSSSPDLSSSGLYLLWEGDNNDSTQEWGRIYFAAIPVNSPSQRAVFVQAGRFFNNRVYGMSVRQECDIFSGVSILEVRTNVADEIRHIAEDGTETVWTKTSSDNNDWNRSILIQDGEESPYRTGVYLMDEQPGTFPIQAISINLLPGERQIFPRINYECLPPGGRTMPTKTTGPGTHLKNMLAAWGIHAKKSGGCKCRDWEVKMNRWGSECSKHMDAIVDHLQAEAKKRNLPFVRRAGEMLVKRAIKRFEKES